MYGVVELYLNATQTHSPTTQPHVAVSRRACVSVQFVCVLCYYKTKVCKNCCRVFISSASLMVVLVTNIKTYILHFIDD